MRRLLAVSAALLGLVPATAQGQGLAPASPPPTLPFAPPTGIARGDFATGTVTDIPAATAVDGDRIYTVGRTLGGSGGSDIGVLARRSDGSFDAGFSGDGKLIVSIASGTQSDIGTGVIVLPDRRVRIVAATDVVAGSSESFDVAIVGLNPDGTPDTTFGDLDGSGLARTGQTVFPVGLASDTPTRIVA